MHPPGEAAERVEPVGSLGEAAIEVEMASKGLRESQFIEIAVIVKVGPEIIDPVSQVDKVVGKTIVTVHRQGERCESLRRRSLPCKEIASNEEEARKKGCEASFHDFQSGGPERLISKFFRNLTNQVHLINFIL